MRKIIEKIFKPPENICYISLLETKIAPAVQAR